MKFLKKLLPMAILLALALSISAPYAVHAETPVNVTVDGLRVSFPDHGPAVVEGRVLVPVRGVFEAVGFDVGWNDNTRTATLTSNEYVVNITIGSASFTTNGVSHTLDIPARIIDGRTMLPIRAVLESTGFRVDWIETSRTVRISTPEGTITRNNVDWISIGNFRMPSTWTHETWRGTEFFGEGVGGPIHMHAMRIEDDEILLLLDTSIEGYQFEFADGTIGAELLFPTYTVWINGNMGLYFWHGGNVSSFTSDDLSIISEFVSYLPRQ